MIVRGKEGAASIGCEGAGARALSTHMGKQGL